jgi:hypothetical protein
MGNVSSIGTGSTTGVLGAPAAEGGNTVEVIGRDIAKLEALARRIGGVAARGAGAARSAHRHPCRAVRPRRTSRA